MSVPRSQQQVDYYNRLENIYEYFYKEKGDMERSMDYEKLALQTPEIKVLWEQYKQAIDEAHLIFEFRFEKLLKRHE